MKRVFNGVLFSCAISLITACGVGSGDETQPNASLNQAGYITGTGSYVYGTDSLANISISGLPADADLYRWAMLDDGTQRLFMFKGNGNTTLYQFGYNPNTGVFEHGFNGNTSYGISGAPADADPTSIAMLYGQNAKRLYMHSISNPEVIYQFRYDSTTNNFVFGSGGAIPALDITGAPVDVDWDRWAMAHDGTYYRLYAARQGSHNVLYQFVYNASTGDYEYGFNATTPLFITGMPADSHTDNFAKLHDGSRYRFYFLAP